jgi:hypothetical protein
MTQAQTYLSTSNGVWRVIHRGLPLCADTTLAKAKLVALQYGYSLDSVPVWDGDAGRFSVYSSDDWQTFAS